MMRKPRKVTREGEDVLVGISVDVIHSSHPSALLSLPPTRIIDRSSELGCINGSALSMSPTSSEAVAATMR